MVRTHWWLRSYSSQALERYKLKAECLFLICLGLLFALNCSFWYTKVARCLDCLTTEEQKRKERKRTRTTKRYTSNSLKLVEEVTPQILFLDTKPFAISVDAYF